MPRMQQQFDCRRYLPSRDVARLLYIKEKLAKMASNIDKMFVTESESSGETLSSTDTWSDRGDEVETPTGDPLIDFSLKSPSRSPSPSHKNSAAAEKKKTRDDSSGNGKGHRKRPARPENSSPGARPKVKKTRMQTPPPSSSRGPATVSSAPTNVVPRRRLLLQ